MIVFEIVINALESIFSNKLRSFLSILGIIIGVGSVIVLNAIGTGSQKDIMERIESMGVNILTVTPGGNSDVRGGGGGSDVFRTDILEYLRNNLSLASKVSGLKSGRGQLIHDSNNTSASVYGIDTSYFDLQDMNIEYGKTIDKENINKLEKKAVIGNELVQTLFPDSDPLGENIKMGNNIYQVIGVLEETGGREDSYMYIPLSTAMIREFGNKYLDSILVTAKNPDQVNNLQNELETKLLSYYGWENMDEAKFSVTNRSDMVERINEISGTMTMFLSGIAAISLIVGGIGVMNIMLVSVTERTKEIGIRKSIGAQRYHILLQFLIESALLSLLGGTIGIGISYSVAWLLNSKFGISTVIEMNSIILAFGFSLFIGVFFGLLPAYKASKLRPIDALRFE